MAYIFAQRVNDFDVLAKWIEANIPKEHIVRTQCERAGILRDAASYGIVDYRIVLDNADSARKLRDYMDGPEFAPYIVHRMDYFMVSWYPLRPQNLE